MLDGSPTPSWISFRILLNRINIAQSTPFGTIIVRLWKKYTSTLTFDYADFELTGTDTGCLRFTPSGVTFSDLTLYLGESLTMKLPPYENEVSPPSLVIDSVLPWVTQSSSMGIFSLIFRPTLDKDAGEGQTILFRLYDGSSSPLYSVKINVRNRPP